MKQQTSDQYLQKLILQLIAEKGRMAAFDVTEKLQELTKGKLSLKEGALYPLLHKMEADGLLNTEIEDAENRKRKYYSLVTKGRKQTSNLLDKLTILPNHINLVNLKLT